MKRNVALGMLLVLAFAGAAVGQPREAKSIDTSPDWLRKPDPEAMYAAFPTGATAKKGNARLTCIVTVQGLVRNCVVATETPAGQGFGSAALTLVPQFLFRPATHDGKPVESEATIPINFDCEGAACGSVSPGGRKVLTGLAWAIAPTQLEMVAAYPAKAHAAHILGVTSIQCLVTPANGLGSCDVMSEEPNGHGFGRAGMTLARQFHNPTNVPAGTKIAGSAVRLTFTFGEQMYDGAPYVAKPKFTQAPTPEEMFAVYPKAALTKDLLSGSAIVKCKVVTEGQLTDCSLLSETPVGEGFGAAVLALAPKFHLSTWTDDGLPVIGTSVKLPIRFDIKDRPAPSPGP